MSKTVCEPGSICETHEAGAYAEDPCGLPPMHVRDRAREWLNENGCENLDDAAYEARLAKVEEELAAIDAARTEEES